MKGPKDHSIRFIKGHRSRPLSLVNHQRRGGAGRLALFAPAWLIASPRNDILCVCAPYRSRSVFATAGEAVVEAKPIYRHADHKIRDWAPSQRFDGMAHPRALM
jgi:hypothetical protein